MSGLPWVRFFPSDWLAGSRGLSASEAGVYISLIAMMYEHGEPLAEDPQHLSRLCGASNSQFKKALESLVTRKKILRVEGGLWNARVEKEQVYRSEKSQVGKQAAETRWQKAKQNQYPTDANAMQTQCDRNANQKPEPDTVIANAIPEQGAIAKSSFSREFAEKFWPAYPNKVGKPDALKKFEIARRSASLEEILDGLARYVATKPPDRNWCNPATWLHQGRWTDEPAPQPLLRVAASNPAPKPRRFGDEFADFLRGDSPHQQRDERTIDGTVQRR